MKKLEFNSIVKVSRTSKFIPDFLKGKVGTVNKIDGNNIYVEIQKEIFKLNIEDVDVLERPNFMKLRFYVYNKQNIVYDTLNNCIILFKELLKENDNSYLAIGVEDKHNALDVYTRNGISTDFKAGYNVFTAMYEIQNMIKVIEKRIK